MNKVIIADKKLQSKIYIIRDTAVMLDSDLAEIYEIETRTFNQAVKRNLSRFPEKYRFQLTDKEFNNLRSQIVISSEHGGRRYLPYAFTEQGVSMLSAILKSDTAIDISIKIIDSFVAMRKFLTNNAGIFQRVENIEQKLLKHDDNFNKLFNALESNDTKPTQGIFYDGEVFDAYTFVNKLIKSAKNNITLIDNYIDETVLTILSKNPHIKITIYTKNISQQLKLDVSKYNEQYDNLELKKFELSHDRFLIIDNEVYHIGSSLKDLGKKWFAFSKMAKSSFEFLDKLP
ncbi:MAG: ORF6N domain-containing protein [Proteobacteria bacterium]|jgi:hypothetical protein|nr:ORF6N domain-containing protein [Pseudomonadota bacterium]